MESDCVEWRPHLMRGCDKKVLIGLNRHARFFERLFEFGSLAVLDLVDAGMFVVDRQRILRSSSVNQPPGTWPARPIFPRNSAIVSICWVSVSTDNVA